MSKPSRMLGFDVCKCGDSATHRLTRTIRQNILLDFLELSIRFAELTCFKKIELQSAVTSCIDYQCQEFLCLAPRDRRRESPTAVAYKTGRLPYLTLPVACLDVLVVGDHVSRRRKRYHVVHAHLAPERQGGTPTLQKTRVVEIL